MRIFLFVLMIFTSVSGFSQFSGSQYCLEMTGMPRWVNVPTSSGLSPTAMITAEAWIYATSWGANAWSNTVVSKEDWASGSRGYVLRCGNGGRLSFNIGIGTAWHEAVTSVPVLNLQQWHHVAGTFNGTQIKIYVDGIEVGTHAITATITPSPYDFRIGECTYSSMSSRPFSGRIDEVRIWSTALSIGQIREYMCRDLTSSHPAYPYLEGYWKLNEGGTSATTADASGNGNHGTLVSGPVWTRSGAPLGEISAYSYAAPFTVSLDHLQDSISVSNLSPTPTGVQVYRISGQPDNLNLPAGYSPSQAGDGYYGVRVFGSPNAAYSFHLKLKTLPGAMGCMPTIIQRADNALVNWNVTSNYLDVQSLSATLPATGKQEFMVYFGRNSIITYNGPGSVCQGDSVILTAMSQSGFVYQWLKNNGPVAGGNSSSLVVKQTGDYSVIVTNAGQCTDTSDIKTILVNPKPNVQISPSGPVTFCQGGEVSLHVHGASSYLWSNQSTLDSILVSQSGKYMVWGVDTNGCVDSSSQVVVVHALPVPVISLNGTLLSTGQYASYQWFLNNNLIPSATQSGFMPVQNGIYKVEVTDSNGCAGTSAPYTLSNVGIGTPDAPLLGLRVFPNPTVPGIFQIEYEVPEAARVTFRLTNIHGQEIQRAHQIVSAGNQRVEIDGAGLTPGIYFGILEYRNEMATIKVVLMAP